MGEGDLGTALGAPASTMIRVQPLNELSTPDSLDDTVEGTINRALEQRPELQADVAGIRSAEARRKEARAAFFPKLSVQATPSGRSLYVLQQTLPWGHTADLNGGLSLNLNWTVFDGGARRSRLEQAEAVIRGADAAARATGARIENEVSVAVCTVNTSCPHSA